AHTSFRFSPSKVRHGDIYLARGHMAPKPEPAMLAYVFGIVLAVAAIPSIMAWANRHWAAPSASPVYHSQTLILHSAGRAAFLPPPPDARWRVAAPSVGS